MRYKHLILALVIVFFCLILSACGTKEGSWNMPSANQTGICPQIGIYHFNQRGSFRVIQGSASPSQRYIDFSSDGYRHDTFEVINGAFSNEWGEILPKGHFPTDAYAISGSFKNETTATGYIKYAFSGRITSEADFVAELIPLPTSTPTSTISPVPTAP